LLALLLCLPPLCPACFLCSRNLSPGGWGHRASFAGRDGNNLFPFVFRPCCALNGCDSGTTGGGHSSSRAGCAAACTVQRRDCVIETFKLRRETDAFVLELIEHRGEIGHGRHGIRGVSFKAVPRLKLATPFPDEINRKFHAEPKCTDQQDQACRERDHASHHLRS